MTLTLLGTATSQGVPVIACACAVCKSSDPRDQRLRSSALFSSGGKNLVVDAGPDFRQQMLRARVERIEGIVITHEHNDHTAGLDDLRPFCFRQNMDIPVYCLPRVAADLRERFAYAFSDYPGVPRLDIREVNFGDTVLLDGREIEFVEVTHGTLPIIGLCTRDSAYLTDVKQLPQRTLERCRGKKHVVISALNHTGTHSHLSLAEALAYLRELGAERGVLTHFSHTMGRAARVNPTLPAGVEMGFDGFVIR